MKINEAWLRDWVDPPHDRTALAEILTLGGLEVDGVEAVAATALDGVLVARVETVSPHPEADKLAVCTVSSGDARHTVVCGAPNVRPGLLTAYAPPGTVLPDGRRLERAAIRGVDSDGMLCAAAELGSEMLPTASWNSPSKQCPGPRSRATWPSTMSCSTSA